MNALNRYWRLLATGHSFALLFVGGFVLALTVLPLIRLCPGSTRQRDRRVRRCIHHLLRFYVWQMRACGLITLEVQGRERLQAARRQVIIANHPSLLDVILLIALLPDCCCVVKNTLQRSLVRGVIRATGYIDNSSGERLLARCREELDAGSPLLIFPEGTRSTPGQPLVFQRGASQIAVRCQADLLPVVIRCDPPTLLKGEPWYKIPPRRPHFTVAVRDPIPVQAVTGTALEPSLATRRLNRHLLDYYQGILVDA